MQSVESVLKRVFVSEDDQTKISTQQWFHLLDAICNDQELRGNFTGGNGKTRKVRKWTLLAVELNAMGGRPEGCKTVANGSKMIWKHFHKACSRHDVLYKSKSSSSFFISTGV